MPPPPPPPAVKVKAEKGAVAIKQEKDDAASHSRVSRASSESFKTVETMPPPQSVKLSKQVGKAKGKKKKGAAASAEEGDEEEEGDDMLLADLLNLQGDAGVGDLGDWMTCVGTCFCGVSSVVWCVLSV